MGYNADHELGDGASTADSLAPVQVGGLTSVTAIAGGIVHALALRSDGSVWAWGKGDNGELGDNATTDSGIPVQVVGLSGVTQVAAGNHLSVALKSDGTVWAWGQGEFGELGNQTWSDSSVPVQVSGLTGVRGVAAGYYHALAVEADGSAWAWGDDSSGELGIGSSGDMWSVPVRVRGIGGPSQLAAGYSDSFALQPDDVVLAWGYDGHGELGIGSTNELHAPGFDAYDEVQAEDFNYGAGSGVKVESTTDSGGGFEVDQLKGGDWLAYGDVDFGVDTAGAVSFSARIASGNADGGSIEVHLDSPTGPLVATAPVSYTGGWGSWVTATVAAPALTGTHTLVLVFASPSNKAFVAVNWFSFAQGAVSTSVTTAYSYDAAGQLVREQPSNGPATTYSYDGLGHRVSATAGGVVTTYAYDAAGELCWSATEAAGGDCASPPSGATAYSYDAAGRLLGQSSDGTHSTGYTYDAAGRLQALHLVDGSFDTTQTRSYNPGGDLTGIANTGSSTTVADFVWDDAAALPTLAAETTNGSTTDLIRGNAGWAAALLSGGQLAGIGLDALGDVVPTTSTAGLAAGGDGYDAWGNPTLAGPSLEPALGYRGELQLGSNVDLRARDYDTTLGAFTSVDPLDGVNGTTTVAAAYPYADNNPIANTDPTGESATDYNAFVWNGRYDYIPVQQARASVASWLKSYESGKSPQWGFQVPPLDMTYEQCVGMSFEIGDGDASISECLEIPAGYALKVDNPGYSLPTMHLADEAGHSIAVNGDGAFPKFEDDWKYYGRPSGIRGNPGDSGAQEIPQSSRLGVQATVNGQPMTIGSSTIDMSWGVGVHDVYGIASPYVEAALKDTVPLSGGDVSLKLGLELKLEEGYGMGLEKENEYEPELIREGAVEAAELLPVAVGVGMLFGTAGVGSVLVVTVAGAAA